MLINFFLTNFKLIKSLPTGIKEIESIINLTNIMETNNENKINVDKIVDAGNALKVVVFSTVISIIGVLISIYVITHANLYERSAVEIIKDTYTYMTAGGIILSIITFGSLYIAGDCLAKVKSN